MSKARPSPRQPLWRGPDVDGITQSLLGRFLECRERFRLRVVEGIVEDEGFSRPLEFGNYFHAAEEARLGGKSWEQALKQYRLTLHRRFPNDETEIIKWYNVCKTQFPIYLDVWDGHKDEVKSKPILEECSFAVPYALPSGRRVLLRGKWDALRLLPLPPKNGKKTGKSAGYGIYIKEHKTKGEIDEEGILKTVAWNLQTMMYQIALREAIRLLCEEDICVIPGPLGKPLVELLSQKTTPLPAGVLYNVIRRPLADFHAIKQKKAESIDTFYRRLGEVIQESRKPNAERKYFMRWKVEVDDEDIQLFKDHTFHPILEQLWDWWEWIRIDPFNPWRRRTAREVIERNDPELIKDPRYEKASWLLSTDQPEINHVHYQSPWGAYNSLAQGFRGSYFNYLTTGRDYGLTKVDTLFPELK